jgi:hypothetical protein
VALSDALKVNTTLKSIDLSRNAIGVEGASALAAALKVNTSVEFIGLHGTYIGDIGASALADALKVNITVTKIEIMSNDIGARVEYAAVVDERRRRRELFRPSTSDDVRALKHRLLEQDRLIAEQSRQLDEQNRRIQALLAAHIRVQDEDSLLAY